MNKVAMAALAVLALSILPFGAQGVELDTPSVHPEGASSEGGTGGNGEACNTDFGTMRRVFPAQVAGIHEQRKVWITEICDSFGGLRSDGNAGALRPAIEANDVVTAALSAKTYSAADVYAVRMINNDTIDLFVHHFN